MQVQPTVLQVHLRVAVVGRECGNASGRSTRPRARMCPPQPAMELSKSAGSGARIAGIVISVPSQPPPSHGLLWVQRDLLDHLQQ